MLKTVSAETSREEIAQILDDDGGVVIEGAVDREIVDRVSVELDGIFERAQFGNGPFVGNRTKRLGSIMRKSGAACQMMLSDNVLNAMDHMLGQNCDRFQLNLSQGICIYPGQPAQVLHRDDELFPCKGFPGDLMANAMWALDDFTADNGATQLVLGSHKWDRALQPEPEQVIAAEMKKGSVLVYRGSAIHGGGANTSDKPRPGLIFSYNLGWLRQGENQYLAYPPEIAKYLPARAQELIGYAIHRPNVGQYECADPSRLLTPFGAPRLTSQDFLTPEQEMLLAQYMESRAA